MDLRLVLGFLCIICGLCLLTSVNGGNFGRAKPFLLKGYGYGRHINKVSLFKAANPDGDQNGNKFMSPFSVMTALMLTMLGTGGNTERQIMSALNLNGIRGNVHRKYKQLQDYLNTALTNHDIIVSIANRLFPKLGVALKQQYLIGAERYYGIEVKPLDFVGQPEISRQYINDWASNKTNNLINDILPKGSITRNSIMFLVNAIYFKGSWKLKFDKTKTKNSDFYLSATVTEKVEMMNMRTKQLRSGTNKQYDCKVLELPYKGEDFNMLVILPNSVDGVPELETKLTADALLSLKSSLRKQETIVSIPKFEILSGFKSLIDPLKQLGITDLFNELADFTKMFVNPSGLMVDKVIHKAFVNVDEEGTEAAAVTVVGVVRTSLQLPLKNGPGAIIFMGLCLLTSVNGGNMGRAKPFLLKGYGYGYGRHINKAPRPRLDTLRDSITKFSVSLFKTANPDGDPNGNKFMSPFSVMAALMLTMLGTGGNTERQIKSALNLNGIRGNVHREYKQLQDYLNTALANDDIIVSIANRLFPKLGFALRQQYMIDAEVYYGSEVEPLDFVGQPEISRQYINDWASNKTNNLIKDILPKGSITRNSIMFLVNAIYFKGSWKLKFDKTKTKKSDFYLTSTVTEKVEMMNIRTKQLRSGINIQYDCKVLELPYKGEDFKMLIVLPNSVDGLPGLETKLTADALLTITSGLRKQDTIVSIPNSWGSVDLFTGLADFSKMFVNPSGFMVDKVIHKAYVSVDEEGTEAAAVTVVGVFGTSIQLPLIFNANHPFIFLIQEKQSGAILFMGRYVIRFYLS
ncbi:hypothetical protein KUTeg_002039 [Tegillarca granosa]|uniref:Serpin domain-containing protein n=1 Tax=Tegillarca granosa TaxID=220873 RepID=A0ABQ9FT74_TEGGR|nr:hypothetical protein KUTeg_002039 [Tegillarca granosa]